MGPIRILLVDDDELIRMSIGPLLAALGHEVHTAEGGQEALDRFQAGLEVDLVILDMNMPGLNGAQTLSRLLELRPGQTVLMATGYSDESIAPLLGGRPRVFSLRKPFSLREIQNKLQAMAPFTGS
jgi:CheY-like chemotaxis protein